MSENFFSTLACTHSHPHGDGCIAFLLLLFGQWRFYTHKKYYWLLSGNPKNIQDMMSANSDVRNLNLVGFCFCCCWEVINKMSKFSTSCETCQYVSKDQINQEEALWTDLLYGNLCYTVEYLSISWLHSEKKDYFSNSNLSLRGRHRSRERALWDQPR